MRNLTVFFLINLFLLYRSVAAQSPQKENDFNLVEFAMHHIGDSYSWDFYTVDHKTVGINLPRILFNPLNKKIDFFWSTHRAVEHGYLEEHEFNPEAIHGALLVPQSKESLESLADSLKLAPDSASAALWQVRLNEKIKESRPLDFSITKNVLFLFFASVLLLSIFISIARRYQKNPNTPPKGLQSALEPVIIFIRDDIAKTYLPHHYEKYLPLLLNFFFFIWFLNMMGLIPFSGNVTGNIAVTASLALITMVVTNVSAKKHYWGHILWFPGVPVFVKPIMFVVELVSVFTKPFALTIRLFANITAGHLVIISFISLIFIFGKLGQVPAAGWATSVVSVAFALFIDLIEILIALLQAYIFTTLSALFIGQAVEHGH